MYDIVLWLSEVDTFLVLVTVIVGYVIVKWMLAQWRARVRRRVLGLLAQLWAFVVQVNDIAPTSTTEVLNARKLSSELNAVDRWYQLGINLSLQPYELNKIERDCRGSERRMLQMLDLWLRRTPNASWGNVVSALLQMGEDRVADNICQKYIRGGSKLYITESDNRYISPQTRVDKQYLR